MCQGKKFIKLYQKDRICSALKAESFPASSSGEKIIRMLGKKSLTQRTRVACGQPGLMLGLEIEFSVGATNRAGLVGFCQIVFILRAFAFIPWKHEMYLLSAKRKPIFFIKSPNILKRDRFRTELLVF